MNCEQPGLHPHRLAVVVRAGAERVALDLSGSVVLTEAATGAYVVTPLLAALAGARRVYALACPTQYGTVEEITAQTERVASHLGIADRIEVITQKSDTVLAQADIVTNSGHVRPIDAAIVAQLKPSAVIPLMYESWEFREGDVNLEACYARGILVAGTNEQHPAIDVFSFLGVMAIKLLLDAGVAVYASHVLLLCDNAFGPFIERGLVRAGAQVDTRAALAPMAHTGYYDAMLVALQPHAEPVLSVADACMIAKCWPGVVVAQFWGDLDRQSLAAVDVPVWPAVAPAPGHMGILPSAVGTEPIVRLQAGGLKMGEILMRARYTTKDNQQALQMASASGLVQSLAQKMPMLTLR